MFWFGMSYSVGDVPKNSGWKEGTQRLIVTMVVEKGEPEEVALKRFIEKFGRIPKDEMDRYICKHSYRHTEDCSYCSFKMEKV